MNKKTAITMFCGFLIQSFGAISDEKIEPLDCDLNPESCWAVPQGPGSGGTGGPDKPSDPDPDPKDKE